MLHIIVSITLKLPYFLMSRYIWIIMSKQASWAKVIWRKNLPSDDETGSRWCRQKSKKRVSKSVYVYMCITRYTRRYIARQRVWSYVDISTSLVLCKLNVKTHTHQNTRHWHSTNCIPTNREIFLWSKVKYISEYPPTLIQRSFFFFIFQQR